METGARLRYVACMDGHVACVRLCLSHGADVNRQDVNGYSPLYAACGRGHNADVVRLCLDSGAAVDHASQGGVGSLYLSCFMGHVDTARLLIERGAAINGAANNVGWTTPDEAAREGGHAAMAAWLGRVCVVAGRAIFRNRGTRWWFCGN